MRAQGPQDFHQTQKKENQIFIFCKKTQHFFMVISKLNPAEVIRRFSDERLLWDRIFLGSEIPFPKSRDLLDFLPNISQIKIPLFLRFLGLLFIGN